MSEATVHPTAIVDPAATQVAELHAGAGHRTAAGRASARASSFAALSSGASSPALRDRVPFLTRREEEIARLAAQGLTSREIGSALVISPRTVDNHRSKIRRKLNVSNTFSLRDTLQSYRI